MNGIALDDNEHKTQRYNTLVTGLGMTSRSDGGY